MAKTKKEGRPDKIKIGPFTWDIDYKAEGKLKDIHRAGGEDMMGCTFPDKLLILIGVDERPEQAIKDTFLHELLHAIIFTFSIKVPFSMDEKEEFEREEVLVSQLSSGLLDTMQTNTHLMDWLLRSDA